MVFPKRVARLILDPRTLRLRNYRIDTSSLLILTHTGLSNNLWTRLLRFNTSNSIEAKQNRQNRKFGIHFKHLPTINRG